MPPTKTIRPSRTRRRVPSPNHPSANHWQTLSSQSLQILQVPAFSKLPWLVHGFSTLPGGVSELDGHGVLNLGFTEWDTRENVLENRRRFQSALSASDLSLVTLRQFHSDIIHLVDSDTAKPRKGDASLTNRPGVLLAVQTADCVPILLVDPKKRAVAAIHAGWRGTLARIAVKAAGQMQMHFGSRPSDLLAVLGPAIGGCCYEVGVEVATQFLSQFAEAPAWFDEFRTGDEPNPIQWLNMAPPGHQPPPKNVFLDLRKSNRAQLLELGLHPQNIFVSDLCTACRPDLLFSYRKQGPRSARLMSLVGIRPSTL